MANVRKDVLPNGLTVLTEPMSSVRSVSVGIWLRTGARQERVKDNGISHFIEHMLFKGTKNRSAEEIARAADSIGGHLDAFTAKETTNYSIKVLDEHLPRAFGILSDLVKNPLFEPEHITNESRVIQEEIKMVEDTPDDLVHEIFTQTYWRGHALGRPILGTRRSVGGFDRKRLVQLLPPALCAEQPADRRRRATFGTPRSWTWSEGVRRPTCGAPPCAVAPSRFPSPPSGAAQKGFGAGPSLRGRALLSAAA
jgi:predicted Zn-dependent peptidase